MVDNNMNFLGFGLIVINNKFDDVLPKDIRFKVLVVKKAMNSSNFGIPLCEKN